MKQVFAALMFGAAMIAAPVASAQQVGAPFNPRVGEQYTIHMDLTETVVANGETMNLGVGSVTAVTVLSDAPNDRRWLYTPVSVDYSGMADATPELEGLNINWPLMNEGMSALVRLFGDIGVECRVDAFGRCTEMTNWPMWSARAENTVIAFDAFAQMVEAMSAAGDTTKASVANMPVEDAPEAGPLVNWSTMREPVLHALSALIDGVDSRSAASFAAYFQPLAAVQGRTMARGESQAVTEEWAMPWGGTPITLSGTLTLDRIDRRANTATYVRHATLDAASVRTSLEAMSEYMITRVIEPTRPYLGAEAENIPDADAMRGLVTMFLPMFNMTMEETTTGIVDLATGMARQTTTDYVIVISGPPDQPDSAVTTRARYVLTVEPGAPAIPHLPRAAAN